MRVPTCHVKLPSAAPAPARRRWNRVELVGRRLGCPPLATAGGERQSPAKPGAGLFTRLLVLTKRRRLFRSNRLRPRWPKPSMPTLLWASHSRCPGEERGAWSLLWPSSACVCVVLSIHGQRRIESVSRRKSRESAVDRTAPVARDGRWSRRNSPVAGAAAAARACAMHFPSSVVRT